MPSKSEYFRPRLCVLEKGDNGYGFHLHGEKGKTGQFIRLVEPDSPSETSGLRAGDRLVFVNGENVENESHQQVVSRIQATAGRLELIVVDPDTEQLLKKHNIKCLKEYVTDGIPLPLALDKTEEDDEQHMDEEVEEDSTPRESTPVPDGNGEMHIHIEKKLSITSEKEQSSELRPRLCVIQRDSSGYGFNLHSEKARPGQFIRAVDEDSPAERAGLQAMDRIVEVNGMPVEEKTHSDVVAAIKASGDETVLLVVGPDADAFFKKCRVIPSLDHLTGPLPEPAINGDMEEKANGEANIDERNSKLSVSPSPSNASSNAALTPPQTSTPPEEEHVVEAIPALNLSLQQVKERAHQKRSNKRAPPMDWSKKNELFSNL